MHLEFHFPPRPSSLHTLYLHSFALKLTALFLSFSLSVTSYIPPLFPLIITPSSTHTHFPLSSVGRLLIEFSSQMTMERVQKENPNVTEGGRYTPPDCRPRWKVGMHKCGMKQPNSAGARSIKELLPTKARCFEPTSKAKNRTFALLVHVPEQEKPHIQVKMLIKFTSVETRLSLDYRCGQSAKENSTQSWISPTPLVCHHDESVTDHHVPVPVPHLS